MAGTVQEDQALKSWIAQQRWFANSTAANLTVEAALPFGGDGVRDLLVRDATPAAEALYQVPVVDRGQELPADGPHDPAFVAALVTAVLGGAALEGGGIRAEGVPIGWSGPVPAVTASRVLSGEQSNTSVIVETDADRTLMVKVFRALHHGENPDVVLQAAIAAAGSDRVPATHGALVGEWPGADGDRGTGHLAVVQEFLQGTRDAWRVALDAARAGEDFTVPARDLGAATAEVHRVLARALPTAEADARSREAIGAGMRARAAQALALVPSLASAARAIDDVLLGALEEDWPPLQRIHGDYHLGQVLLVPDRGWVLLDFEGEPLRPMAERTAPDLPLRDVAGMLRSFDYVAGTIELEGGGDAARAWAQAARAAFLAGYEAGLGASLAGHRALLDALELDKALYECVYEVRNRPDWLPIPRRAVERLIGAAA